MGRYAIGGLSFETRPLSSDRKAVDEVVKRRCYTRKSFQVQAGERWLDLGANIGAFTCYAASKGADVVAAYEPEPENAAAAERNIALNQFSTPVIRKAVVADHVTQSHLNLYLPNRDSSQWRNSLYKNKNSRAVSVETVHVSDLLDGIDAVKMDIEGAEIDILFTIANFKQVQKLVFEYHFDVNTSIPLFLQIAARLNRFFDHVYHRKFLPDEVEYTHFPPATNVFCWNGDE